MEIFIKLAARHYELLRERVPGASPAHQALAKATPIEHSVDGVEFEGYTVPCDGEQARALLAAVRKCCPEITAAIEKAIGLQ